MFLFSRPILAVTRALTIKNLDFLYPVGLALGRSSLRAGRKPSRVKFPRRISVLCLGAEIP